MENSEPLPVRLQELASRSWAGVQGRLTWGILSRPKGAGRATVLNISASLRGAAARGARWRERLVGLEPARDE